MDYRNPDYQAMGYAPIGAFAPRRETRYGGFWIRVAAYLLDLILLVLVQLILDQALDSSAQVALLNGLFGWFYFAGCESMLGGTPGKRICGLRVVDEDGRDISFLRATGRYFAKFISSLILMIGFIMVAFDSEKQGLHDKLAGTYVIKD